MSSQQHNQHPTSQARTLSTELHYKATVDDEEWAVSSIKVDSEWTLKKLKKEMLSQNEWDAESTVSFRNSMNLQFPLTTPLQKILTDNKEDSPLCVIVEQHVQKPPAPKKPKFDELKGDLSNAQILEFLGIFAKKHFRREDESENFCYPLMVSETWNSDKLYNLFRKKRATVLENIRNDDDPRAPFIVTVVAGLGNGKTHFLKAAPGFVGEESLYITYNQGQDLDTDKLTTRKALLLRIIFQTFGTGSFGAANFLTSSDGKSAIETWEYERLLSVAAERLNEKFARTTGFLICVDETRKLESLKKGATADLLSVLGALAVEVYKLSGRLQCTPLATALDNDGVDIYSTSHRKVETLELPTADSSAVDFVCRVMKLPEELIWKVFTVAGSHFRSIVTAIKVLNGGSAHVDIERLFSLSYNRLQQTLDKNTALAIEAYLKDMMERGGAATIPAPLRSLCSTDDAIPPTLICSAFRIVSRLQQLDADKHAFGIFHNDIDNDAFNQLELSAKSFDLLRSVWGMNVIPSSMKICNGPLWYSELRFPRSMQTSDKGILQTKGQQQKEVVWSGLRPKIGVYYHPGLANHPWIDRFFVAQAKDESQKCLVLYQDKINAAGFPNAVKDLNLAARILKQNLNMPVLCIANVIGASSQTRSQSRFEYPYVLVRDEELDGFYTTNFSHAMRFLRTRFRDAGTKQGAGGATNEVKHMNGNESK